MEQENKTSIGPIIGTIIIIAIIVLGGLYFWGKRIEETKSKENLMVNFTPETSESTSVDTTSNINSGDDLDSIEADLNATNLDNIAPELE